MPTLYGLMFPLLLSASFATPTKMLLDGLIRKANSTVNFKSRISNDKIRIFSSEYCQHIASRKFRLTINNIIDVFYLTTVTLCRGNIT